MSAGSSAASLALLVLACAVIVLLHVLRAGADARLRGFLSAGLIAIVVVLTTAHASIRTVATYPQAVNHRQATAAAQTLKRESATADCVIVVDGSSVFAHGVREDVLREELIKAGHRPCVAMLSLPGADHFQRECSAEDLRAQLDDVTRARVDQLPLIWLKELHWLYESLPARFVAKQSETDNIMSVCDPERVLRMRAAIKSNWKEARGDKSMNEKERAEAKGEDRVQAAIRIACFNLFQTGVLQRVLELPVQPLTRALEIEHEKPLPPDAPKPFWEKRARWDRSYEISVFNSPRKWFEELAQDLPSSWPKREGLQVVMVQPPSWYTPEQRYAKALEAKGSIAGHPLLLGSRDQELLKQLNDIHLWRDGVHVEQEGAVIFTRWLAARLLPLLQQPNH